jgi:hypothetical protein
MTLQLHLPLDIELRLREQARRNGQPIEQFVLDAVHEKLRTSGPAKVLEGEAWLEAFDAFVRSRPRREGIHMDDSRESIYEGRGE